MLNHWLNPTLLSIASGRKCRAVSAKSQPFTAKNANCRLLLTVDGNSPKTVTV